jgi:hypothetical protein
MAAGARLLTSLDGRAARRGPAGGATGRERPPIMTSRRRGLFGAEIMRMTRTAKIRISGLHAAKRLGKRESGAKKSA